MNDEDQDSTQDLDNDSPAQNQDQSTPDDAGTPDDQQSDDQNQQPDAQSSGAQAAPVGTAPPQQMAQQMNQDAADIQQDFATGKIKPETYHDLFAHKETLGKIGTLFGLLLSGAGSGLAHQSNAVADMMNREVDRDLEAQKASNENARNWYQMHLQHEMQKAQIPQIQAQTGLAQAQTGAIPSEIAERQARVGAIPSEIQAREAQAKEATARAGLTGKESQIKSVGLGLLNGQPTPQQQAAAANAAKTSTTLAAIQYQQDQIDKLGEGPQKVKAQATLDALKAQNNQDILKRNAQTAGQVGLINQMTGKGSSQPIDSGINDQLLLQKLNKGANLKSTTGLVTPDAIDPADAGEVTKEVNGIKLNRATYGAYTDTFRKLQNMFAAGNINPEDRKALIGDFQTSLAKQIGEEGAARSVQGMFPSWKDWGKTAQDKFEKTTEHFKINESGAGTLDRYPGVHTPFPDVENPAAKKKNVNQAPVAAVAGTTKVWGGKTYRKGPNGESILVGPQSQQATK